MSIKLSFWVRPSQKNQEKKTPIYMRIQLDGVRTEYSIGHYVNPAVWDSKSQKVRGSNDEAKNTNENISTLKAKALKVYNDMILNCEPFNAFIIKERILNGLAKAMTFDDIMEEYIAKMTSLKGKSYAQPTIIKYRNTQLRVSQYVKKKYKRGEIYLYELDYNFIDGFETFLKIEFNNSNTTCAKHYQRVSRVVRIALNKGYINRFPFGEYKPRIDKAELIYLTYEEVKRIEEKAFTIRRLEMIRKTFLFGCYSGLSFKEMENLRPDNIVTSDGKVHWLKMVRQKTKKQYKVVLLPQAYQLIKDLQEYPEAIRKGRLLPILSNQKYNSYLKELADQCGIPKRLTSHVARKTFSIGIALRSSASIELISALLGHSSIRVTTDYYAKVTDEIMIDGVKNLAEQLKKLK